MKNGQISRNPGCTIGIAMILAAVDFVREAGDILVCYAGNKQIATVPANSTPDLLCSMGLDLDVLRMIREEELATAAAEAGKYRQELRKCYDKTEALLAPANATDIEIQLGGVGMVLDRLAVLV